MYEPRVKKKINPTLNRLIGKMLDVFEVRTKTQFQTTKRTNDAIPMSIHLNSYVEIKNAILNFERKKAEALIAHRRRLQL